MVLGVSDRVNMPCHFLPPGVACTTGEALSEGEIACHALCMAPASVNKMLR